MTSLIPPTAPEIVPAEPGPAGVRVGARARRKRRAHQRGVALLLVLAALTVLTVLLADFQDETSASLGGALSARDSIKAEYAARSAINLSRLFIASEPTIRKTLAPLFMLTGGGAAPPQIPVWEFADQVLGAFNDVQGSEKFAALSGTTTDQGKNLGIEGAGFEIQIVDEDAKINLNAAWRDSLTQARLSAELLGLLSPPQFDPLFSARDADGQYSDRQAVCGALIDWVDPNQEASGCDPHAGSVANAAPEDSFYQLLDAPYARKNAPLDSLEELHLVRGVSDDFWASFIEPDPEDQKQRNVTVWGQGKVNVNTANPQIIMALICGGTLPPAKVCTDPLEAAKFLSLVGMIRTFTQGAPIFSTPKGFINTLEQKSPIGLFLKQLGLEPIKFASPSEAMKAITTESKVFSLIATGYVKAGKRETRVKVHSVVDFRGAPPPPRLVQEAADRGLIPPPAPASTAGGAPTGASGVPLDEDGYPALLVPSPGGRIVYFRID